MAGYTPIALSLTPFSLDDQTVPDRAFDYLVSTHQMSSDLQTSCARLVFDRNTGEWIDTVMITDSRKTVEQLVAEVVGKTGEKIEVRRLVRFELGKK